jgi:hypothetical protein
VRSAPAAAAPTFAARGTAAFVEPPG